MTQEQVTARMAELAHRAAQLPSGDPALAALLAELEALSRLLPTTDAAGPVDEAAEEKFDNMPV
ncbi:MAG: hypothetical protein Q8K20_16990 [Gemmobacter sp.]|jgi:hypothetical protein|nr:hypothetical protein [Gemmobacter sp.]